MNVLVLCGGNSPEREVSLRSGAAVVHALHDAGHQVATLDPGHGPLVSGLFASYDVVFPVLHGIGGEDGTVQSLLTDAGVAYVGSDTQSSRLCFDKIAYKQLLQDNDVLVPQGELVDYKIFRTHSLVQRPFVLKPYDGGSSVDTFIIRDPATADWLAMDAALERYGKMLIEQLIEGAEITVGVVNDQALPVIEIVPPSDGEFDYENKYNGATQELCPPQTVSAELQAQAQVLAVQAHRLAGCSDFSRTDMMIDADGRLFVLETNTIPGMTDQSLLPKAAAVAGKDMSTLCDMLVQSAAKR